MVRCKFRRHVFVSRLTEALAPRQAGGKSHLLEPSPNHSKPCNEFDRPDLDCRFANIPFLRPLPETAPRTIAKGSFVAEHPRGIRTPPEESAITSLLAARITLFAEVNRAVNVRLVSFVVVLL